MVLQVHSVLLCFAAARCECTVLQCFAEARCKCTCNSAQLCCATMRRRAFVPMGKSKEIAQKTMGGLPPEVEERGSDCMVMNCAGTASNAFSSSTQQVVFQLSNISSNQDGRKSRVRSCGAEESEARAVCTCSRKVSVCTVRPSCPGPPVPAARW